MAAYERITYRPARPAKGVRAVILEDPKVIPLRAGGATVTGRKVNLNGDWVTDAAGTVKVHSIDVARVIRRTPMRMNSHSSLLEAAQ